MKKREYDETEQYIHALTYRKKQGQRSKIAKTIGNLFLVFGIVLIAGGVLIGVIVENSKNDTDSADETVSTTTTVTTTTTTTTGDITTTVADGTTTSATEITTVQTTKSTAVAA